MAAKMTKWSPPRALTLAGLTLAAVVTACDIDAPTAIDDALLDVMANPEAAASADGSGNPVSEAVRIGGNLGDGAPLIFVDGVEFEGGSASLRSLNPDDIERIEVIKGEAAVGLHGERAEDGVIQIFTKESDASSNPGPLSDAGNGVRIRIVGNQTPG